VVPFVAANFEVIGVEDEHSVALLGELLCVSKLLAKAENLVKLGIILERPAHGTDPVRSRVESLEHALESGELPLHIFQVVLRSSSTSLALLTDGSVKSNRVRSGKLCSSGPASRHSAGDIPITSSETLSLPVDHERRQAPIAWSHADEGMRGQNGLGARASIDKASQWAGKRVSDYADGGKNRRRMSLTRQVCQPLLLSACFSSLSS
jgi:hypothetical protein